MTMIQSRDDKIRTAYLILGRVNEQLSDVAEVLSQLPECQDMSADVTTKRDALAAHYRALVDSWLR